MEDKRFNFLEDFFDFASKTSLRETTWYLGKRLKEIIPDVSLFVLFDVNNRELLAFAYQEIRKGVFSSALHSVKDTASSFLSNAVLDLFFQIPIKKIPKEAFVDEWKRGDLCFTLTLPVLAIEKPIFFLGVSVEGSSELKAEEISLLKLVVKFLSGQWERLAKERFEKERIERMALVDPLTGGFNRRALYRILPREISEASGKGTTFCLLIFDTDGFKQINDSYGHNFGDLVLKELVSRIRANLRKGDEIFRIGGDEFVVLLRDCEKDKALRIADKISKQIASEVIHDGRVFAHVTVSIGVTCISPFEDIQIQVDEALSRADKALYWAKEVGRNQIFCFEDGRSRLIYRDSFLHSKLSAFTEEVDSKIKNMAVEYLMSLLDALYHRDPHTRVHSTMSSNCAIELGKVMGLHEKSLETLRFGALLHDIGKLGIPDRILLKQGKLTPEEFDIMKQHPIIGAKIVQRFASLRDLIRIILYHHERLDGSGYPFGLSGSYIPLEARIFMVADVFHAMQGARSYKPALSLDQTVSLLLKDRGVKYDAEAVEALLVLIEENKITMEKDTALQSLQTM